MGTKILKKVGLVGWRGMVGSVLIDRLSSENNFDRFQPTFFSTSQAGQSGPDVGQGVRPLLDANSIDALAEMDIVVTCQGGDYTKDVHPRLRASGWDGYWLDAASALRMEESSVIVLDPVNRHVIDRGLDVGIKDYVGGNCTVSLMLMGLMGLFEQGWVEWISTMTYQSASGGGAKHMIELVEQMNLLASCQSAGQAALELERAVSETMRGDRMPTEQFGAPLAGSLIPWIDRLMESGQTREEWKGENETNKILATDKVIPIDGQCVRISAMRCHSQAVTIKLTRDVPVEELEQAISAANDWVSLVPNARDVTCRDLTPTAVSGTMNVPVGRLRKMTIGPEFLTCFTVGDQLLWGAAEPLRRMLLIMLGQL